MDIAVGSLNLIPEQQLSNNNLATVTRHSRSLKFWISPHAQAVNIKMHEGCCVF